MTGYLGATVLLNPRMTPWKWLWTIPWGGSQTAFHVLAQTLGPSVQTVPRLGVAKVTQVLRTVEGMEGARVCFRPPWACQHRAQAPLISCLGWGLSICISCMLPGGARRTTLGAVVK